MRFIKKMLSLRYINQKTKIMGDLIPILGVLTGMVVPVAVFIWLYHDAKHKRETVLEIAKHIDDPEKLDELLHIFDERKALFNIFF